MTKPHRARRPASPDGPVSANRPAASALVMGRYRLVERLGLGGSAEVWRGVDERLGRPVAVKLLHPHLLPDEAARARFEREARAAAGLSHPGIVGVYDAQASDEGAAIIFELVEGESLADRLAREGALSPEETARIAAEVAEALQHAHERGVVHRDVKPGNMLIGTEGRARLVDFGIARLLASEAARVTTAGQISGTLRYLAPEELTGKGAGPAADLYALGLVLYEMLSGHAAFEAATPVTLARLQRAPPSEIPGAPPELAAIALEAIDPDPARRPADAASMAARLREWAGPAAVSPMPLVPAVTTAATEAPARGAVPGGSVPGSLLPSAASDAPTLVVLVPDGGAFPARDVATSHGVGGRPRAVGGGGRRRARRWNRFVAPALLGLIGLALAAFVLGGLSGPAAPAAGSTPSPTFSLNAPSASPGPTGTLNSRGHGTRKTPPGHDRGG